MCRTEDLRNLLSDEEAKVWLKGYLSVEYFPKFYLNEPSGREFVRKFRSRNSTMNVDGSCSAKNNTNSVKPIYEFYTTGQNTSDGLKQCLGIVNFSSFSADTLDAYTLYVYDSVRFTVIQTLKAVWYLPIGGGWNSMVLRELIRDTDSLYDETLTGPYTFSRGLSDKNSRGPGGRGRIQAAEL